MTLYPELRSVVCVPDAARSGIAEGIRHWCAAAPGLETAGLLFIGPDGEGFASSPGLNAAHRRDACEWDAEHIAAVIDSGRAHGATLLGRWHKHTSPVILASRADRESAQAFLRATGLPVALDLIVACDERDEPIGWALYVVTPGEHRRAALQWGDSDE